MLTPSQLKLLSIFNDLDQRIDMSTFNNRLKFQKEVYLIQEFGTSIGYLFGWYRRGPYSSSAAGDGFKLEAIQRDVTELPELLPSEQTSIERYQKTIRESKTFFRDCNDAEILELVASLHFILNKGYPRSLNSEDAVRTLIERKPQFQHLESQILSFLNRVDLRG